MKIKVQLIFTKPVFWVEKHIGLNLHSCNLKLKTQANLKVIQCVHSVKMPLFVSEAKLSLPPARFVQTPTLTYGCNHRMQKAADGSESANCVTIPKVWNLTKHEQSEKHHERASVFFMTKEQQCHNKVWLLQPLNNYNRFGIFLPFLALFGFLLKFHLATLFTAAQACYSYFYSNKQWQDWWHRQPLWRNNAKVLQSYYAITPTFLQVWKWKVTW